MTHIDNKAFHQQTEGDRCWKLWEICIEQHQHELKQLEERTCFDKTLHEYDWDKGKWEVKYWEFCDSWQKQHPDEFKQYEEMIEKYEKLKSDYRDKCEACWDEVKLKFLADLDNKNAEEITPAEISMWQTLEGFPEFEINLSTYQIRNRRTQIDCVQFKRNDGQLVMKLGTKFVYPYQKEKNEN